jgi:signal transduction histidine kinase
MDHSLPMSGSPTAPGPSDTSRSNATQRLSDDPVLRNAFLVVGLAVECQEARVWVRDEGPGVPAEEHEHLWERFRRVKGIEVQSGSGIGLGLGLHISRTIIELHHGQVGVLSAPGEGSTFWFSLPLATSKSAPEGSEPDAPEC